MALFIELKDLRVQTLSNQITEREKKKNLKSNNLIALQPLSSLESSSQLRHQIVIYSTKAI